MKVEILTGETPKVVEMQPQFREVIKFLDEKFPDWGEVVFSNKTPFGVKIITTKEKLVEFPKVKVYADLLNYLDKSQKGWRRIGITKKNTDNIPYNCCKAGMVIRTHTSNTNQYIYVDSLTTSIKGEIELNCIQEGLPVKYNSENCKKYKMAVLIENMGKEHFEKINWPPEK